ncbi:DUF4429 domain-containing protein [Kutzneria sp. 744]|uniref:DUF4429 domain-containing protein n=1 Tax=Kutzneria sp. (strain 744) TaxID=345341 RepID=UPI0003EEB4D2|nr:DUF4429 domain-containing protein [Kutzneria sp. 744]EWM11117.1 LigA protein [Kutzneria sp. 744]
MSSPELDFDLTLAGRNATWAFTPAGVQVNYSASKGVPRLLRRIGQRLVPFEAITSATVHDDDGLPSLALSLRPGSDPYTEVAAGQLPEDYALYRLELDQHQAEHALRYKDTINDRCALTDEPAPRFLLDTDTAPLRLRGFDGVATFDGDSVRLSWGMKASLAKQAGGDQVYRIGELAAVEWSLPGFVRGHLRLRPVGVLRPQMDVIDDPHTLLFGLGYGAVAESLPFAAALTAAIGNGSGPIGDLTSAGVRAEQVAAAIRTLGGLMADGLLSREEFEAKKKHLLDQI